MPLSDAYEDTVLDHCLGTTDMAHVSQVYLALGTDTTVNKTTFTECTTPGSNGYARQAINFNAASTDGTAENAAGTITFGPCTTSSWGTIKSWALFTADTGGTRITQGVTTDQTKVVNVGDSVTVAAGAITVTLTTSGSAVSDTLSGLILDHILGTTDFDGAGLQLYAALGSDTTPNRTTFTEITTAGTNGYARQSVDFNASGTDGVAENAAGTLTFGPCTTSNWGTIKSWALFTASTGGTRYFQGALTDQTKVVNIGDSATIAGGAIVVTAG